MNKKVLRIIFTLMIFSLCIPNLYAQIKKHHHPHHKARNKWHNHHLMYLNNIRVTGMLGLSSYYGDLCDQVVCFKYRPGLTLGGYWRYNEKFSFRGNLTYLRLSGSDKNGLNYTRNLSFRSGNIELAAGVMYDIIPFQRNYHNRSQYTPYVFVEAGMFYYNPRAELNGKWYSLRPLRTEGVKYSGLTPSIPFGGGVRMKINSYMDLGFEIAYRKTFSDYIDDVSTVFRDKNSFTDQNAAKLSDRSAEYGFYANGLPAGNKRGDPHRKDGYFLFGFKFEYMIKVTEQIHNINSMPRFRHKNSGMHRKHR